MEQTIKKRGAYKERQVAAAVELFMFRGGYKVGLRNMLCKHSVPQAAVKRLMEVTREEERESDAPWSKGLEERMMDYASSEDLDDDQLKLLED